MVFETGGKGWDGSRTQVLYPILCPRALLMALLPRGRVSLPMVRRAMLSVLLSQNKQLQDIQCLIGKAKMDPSTNCRTCSRLSAGTCQQKPTRPCPPPCTTALSIPKRGQLELSQAGTAACCRHGADAQLMLWQPSHLVRPAMFHRLPVKQAWVGITESRFILLQTHCVPSPGPSACSPKSRSLEYGKE